MLLKINKILFQAKINAIKRKKLRLYSYKIKYKHMIYFVLLFFLLSCEYFDENDYVYVYIKNISEYDLYYVEDKDWTRVKTVLEKDKTHYCFLKKDNYIFIYILKTNEEYKSLYINGQDRIEYIIR